MSSQFNETTVRSGNSLNREALNKINEAISKIDSCNNSIDAKIKSRMSLPSSSDLATINSSISNIITSVDETITQYQKLMKQLTESSNQAFSNTKLSGVSLDDSFARATYEIVKNSEYNYTDADKKRAATNFTTLLGLGEGAIQGIEFMVDLPYLLPAAGATIVNGSFKNKSIRQIGKELFDIGKNTPGINISGKFFDKLNENYKHITDKSYMDLEKIRLIGEIASPVGTAMKGFAHLYKVGKRVTSTAKEVTNVKKATTGATTVKRSEFLFNAPQFNLKMLDKSIDVLRLNPSKKLSTALSKSVEEFRTQRGLPPETSDLRVLEMMRNEHRVVNIRGLPVEFARDLSTHFYQGIENAGDFFKNFREHAAEHSHYVADYAVKFADQMPGVNLKEVEVAALVHDLGMERYFRVEKIDGKFIDESGEALTSFQRDMRVRENHPLSSAMIILTDVKLPQGVDKDVVALLAMSHSKSTSGIRHIGNAKEWEGAIDKIASNLADFNAKNGTSFTFDAEKLRTIVRHNPDEFLRLQDEARAIRDADAMSTVAVDSKKRILMQDGGHVKLTYKNPRKEYNDPISDTVTGELDEVGVSDVRYYSDGRKPETLNIRDKGEGKSASIHVGESNVRFSSGENHRNYVAVAELNDPNKCPNCTFDAITERIEEVATYDSCESRKFVIKLPKEAEEKKLGKWYDKALDLYVRRKENDAIVGDPKKNIPPNRDDAKFWGSGWIEIKYV